MTVARALRLDAAIRTWWDDDLRRAHESDLCADEDVTFDATIAVFAAPEKRHTIQPTAPTLIYLPFPYSTAAGSESAFPEMYCYDTHYINSALLIHGRHDIVRGHILNQLSLIERFGMVLNANRTYFTTRSQLPLLAESVWRYFQVTGDRDLLMTAFPLLKREYLGYWNAPPHTTPTGLSRLCDLGDPVIRRELAAEAESGMDFTPAFEGRASECTSVALNAILIRTAHLLGLIAAELNLPARPWQQAAETRTDQLQRCCWNQEAGTFFEFNFIDNRQIPVWTLAAYWVLWARAATPEQTERLAANLSRFEQAYGYSFTDQLYASPHPEFTTLQWAYPWGWPPSHIMLMEAFEAAGRPHVVRPVLARYHGLMLDLHEKTGRLWEKYNVVDGSADSVTERYPNRPFHGWASAAAVLLGRMIYGESTFTGVMA
jgi:alpha,alpha-trehalase